MPDYQVCPRPLGVTGTPRVLREQQVGPYRKMQSPALWRPRAVVAQSYGPNKCRGVTT